MFLLARLKRQAMFLVLLCGLGAPAAAVTVAGLYTVQVPVASSSPADRQQAYAKGLEQVLARVSGDTDLLEQGRASELLADAEAMVQSYQFLRGSGDDDQDQLRMSFGSVAVNRALASIDAPVWGANRPLTLAWIVVEAQGRRDLLVRQEEDAQSDDWQTAFIEAAGDRGLPLILPPEARRENSRLLSEVRGQFMGPVRDASENIEHNLLAVVSVSRSGGAWQASWRMEGEGIEDNQEVVSGNSPGSVAEKVIGAWADLLADRYAVSAGDVDSAARVDIVVEGVNTLDDFATAVSALNKMTPVASSDPVQVKADRMTFKVVISGEVAQLEQYIALDQRFVAKGPDSTGSADTAAATSVKDRTSRQDEQPVQLVPERDSDTGNAEAGSLFQYQPLVQTREEDREAAFESLYPTLRYRWQGAPIVAPEASGQ